MTKLRALKKGDTIGIIAPSGSTKDTTVIEKSTAVIEELGFKVVVGKSCLVPRYGYLAASDEVRTQDLEQFFADPNIDGILCMKGGYGCPRILDKINYDIIKSNPKVFIGYSDITALHLAFAQKLDFPTFHAPMAISMIKNVDPFTKASWLKAITSTEPLGLVKAPSKEEGRKSEAMPAINSGKARGRLTGGNLTLVSSLVGTAYALKPEGAIIFLEDVSEAPYRLDRMLSQLRLAGYFEQCNGIILGDYEKCEAPDPERSLSFKQVVEDVIAPCGKPIVTLFNAGHATPTHSFPLGVEVEIDGALGTVNFLESALE